MDDSVLHRVIEAPSAVASTLPGGNPQGSGDDIALALVLRVQDVPAGSSASLPDTALQIVSAFALDDYKLSILSWAQAFGSQLLRAPYICKGCR